jgi:hypothetical protein
MLSLEDKLYILQLSDEGFADGIATMVKSMLLDNSSNNFEDTHGTSFFEGTPTTSTEDSLLLEDNTPFNLE